MNEEKKSFWKQARNACSRIIASLTGRAIFEFLKWVAGALSVSALGFVGLFFVDPGRLCRSRSALSSFLASMVVLVGLILRSHRRRMKELLYFKSIVESCEIEGFWALHHAAGRYGGR